MPSEDGSRSVQRNFLVYVLDDLLLVWDFDWHVTHVGLVLSGGVEVCSELVRLRSAGAAGEGAATGGVARALAVGRVAVAIGHQGVDGSVALEDDGWSPGSEVLPVLNSVRSDVCLDRYFDSGELRCHHNGGHESHLPLSSGDTDLFGIITGLSVSLHDGSVAAPSDGLSAVARALVSGGVTTASAFKSPLRVLSITDAQVLVIVRTELHGTLVRISGSVEALRIILSYESLFLRWESDIDSKVIDDIRRAPTSILTALSGHI